MRLIAGHADVIVPGHGAPFECRVPWTGATRLRVADSPDSSLPNAEETC